MIPWVVENHYRNCGIYHFIAWVWLLFSGIFIVLQLSVGQYVGRLVCRSQWVDDPYWFSGHMFKGQGQTTLLCLLCCPLNIFWPLHLINTKLGAGVAPNNEMIPIDFQVTYSKDKVKPLFWAQCVVHFIYFYPLLTCFGQGQVYTWYIVHLIYFESFTILILILNQKLPIESR